jgi:hypothetical protein
MKIRDEIQYDAAEYLIIFIWSGKGLYILCPYPSVVSTAFCKVMDNSEE